MDGVAYILWDNIQRGTLIDCPHIQKASTSDTVTDRILGVSKTASASAAAIQLFTGNNIGPKGDSVSRGLQARIEVDRIDPENRPFRHSEPGWTEANRPKILQALYTILLGNPELKKSTQRARLRLASNCGGAWWGPRSRMRPSCIQRPLIRQRMMPRTAAGLCPSISSGYSSARKPMTRRVRHWLTLSIS